MDSTVLTILVVILFIAFAAAAFAAVNFYGKNKKLNSVIANLNKDSVTGLNTRESFCEEVEAVLKTAKPGEYMLISLDIDSFKIINEIYGYEVGTTVLKKIANMLQQAYTEQSILCRDKDDVFLIFKPYTSSHRKLCDKEMCDDCISKAVKEVLGEDYGIYFSRGSYKIDNTKEAVNLMIDLSNRARMEGKKTHETTYFVFTEQMRKERETNKTIVFNMENALKNNEFIVLYQPKIELKHNTIAGAEAFVRWVTSTNEILTPGQFVKIFEENSFINELDLHVFEKVCKFISNNSKKYDIPRIAVNLSSVTLLTHKNIITELCEILTNYSLKKDAICLEITEKFFAKDFKMVMKIISDLRKEGFQIALDDFGSGELSLDRLRDIKVDTIKLDKQLLSYHLDEPRGAIVVGNLIKMAKNLMMEVVAEGVEEEFHFDLLKLLNCDMAQGFLFEEPLGEDSFLQIIKDKKNYSTKPKKDTDENI